jgi:hypothetical protein
LSRRNRNLWIELAAIGLFLGSLVELVQLIYFKGLSVVMSRLPDEANTLPKGVGFVFLFWIVFAAALILVAWSLRLLLRDD